nr:MAG TPA: NinG recombination protein [Bacteriophage sp.]
MNMIYVRSKGKKALMPTERGGRIGYLLRHGKAHVVSRVPFVVQLDYESPTYTQAVSLGIDAGSKHIGVSASTEKKELFAAQVELRSDVTKLLSDRRELRRTRRGRKTRYRKPRFDNRRKKADWLAPSIEQKVGSHLKVIRMVRGLLSLSRITIEVAQFDAQKIKNPNIAGEEYQQGEQLGFWNVREYVLARDGHRCVHCKGKSKDPILNVHHLESRKTGGNSPSNLVTLCETCHKAYHRGEFGLKIKRGSSFRDASVMSIMRWAVYERAKTEFGKVNLTYGYATKHTRIENGIAKTHAADAFCIARNVHARRSDSFFLCRCVPRHTRALHVANPKKGGLRRSAIAPHKIGGSRFQRFDMVRWKGKECFIFGSSSGRPVLRNCSGDKIHETSRVNIKTIKFIKRLRNNILMEERASES